MSKYKRPRTHYAVLALNIVVVVGLLVAGSGLMWAGQRLGARQVVTLDRNENATPVDGANIEPSDEWNLTEGDLEAKTSYSRAPTTAIVSTRIPLMQVHSAIATVLANAATRS